MIAVKCLKCGANIKLLPHNFKICRQGKRECSVCGAQIKLSNPKSVGVLIGLIFAGVFLIIEHWSFHFLLSAAIILLTLLFVPLILCKLIGRWDICE